MDNQTYLNLIQLYFKILNSKSNLNKKKYKVWLFINLCFHFKMQDWGVIWSCLFGLIAWRIWKNMNLFIFQNVNWSTYEIVKASLSWTQQFEPHLSGYKVNFLIPVIHSHSEGNWIHFFFYGAMTRDFNNAFAGEVVHN